MSKKMLKRSLALGALMAFVITGSAYANSEWKGNRVSLYLTGGETIIDSITINNTEDNYFALRGYGYLYVKNSNDEAGDISIINVKDAIKVQNGDLEISANDITLKVTGANAMGVSSSDTNDDKFIIRANNLSIYATGEGIHGQGELILSNDLTVSSGSHAVAVESEGLTINANDITLYATGTNAKGLYSERGGFDVTASNDVNITTGGNGVDGYGSLIVIGDLNITSDANAVNARSNELEIVANTITVHNAYDGISGKVNVIANTMDINADHIGVTGAGVLNIAKKLTVESGGNAFTTAIGGLTVNANEIEIDTTGNAFQVQNGNLNITDVNKLNITACDRAIRVASGATANISVNELNISGATEEIKVGNALESDTGTSTLILRAEQGNIESNIIVGETKNDVTLKGAVDLTLGSGVTLTGSVVTDTASESASNITLNGATWNVTGDSNVTTVAGNDGKIVLGLRNEPAAAAYSLRSTGNNNAFYGLQIGDLTNSNLEVSGGAELTEAIENGTVDMTAEEALQQLADAVKTGENSQEETVSKVTIEAGETLGATSATIGEDGTIASITQDVNPQAAKVSKAATNLKAHYRAHMNDMNKRMGELRMANGEAGVWTRMVRGESEYEGAKMQYNQYQLGYDEKLSVDKRWTVGAAVTFAEGDGSYGQGSTDDKSTAFAIYGSKLNNDGTFVDLIARYAHLESDMEDSVYGNGDYSTNGYSVSAEFGKRIQQGNGLWVEPQVELTYGTIDSANFKLGTDYNAHFDSMDSFIARVGFSIGKDIKEGNVYARASYLYDFDGETTSLVTTTAGAGTPTPEDFGGGWWEVGVGANINLSKATYIYADIEKTFGGEVDTNWQWNLGVRYSF